MFHLIKIEQQSKIIYFCCSWLKSKTEYYKTPDFQTQFNLWTDLLLKNHKTITESNEQIINIFITLPNYNKMRISKKSPFVKQQTCNVYNRK